MIKGGQNNASAYLFKFAQFIKCYNFKSMFQNKIWQGDFKTYTIELY